MKRMVVVVFIVLAVLLAGSVASARPAQCYVTLPEAERDAAVASIEALMGAALLTGDAVVDLATLQEAHRVIGVLEAAPSICRVTAARR